MNYVNFNNFQPSSANTFSKEDARVAILMVETKNSKAAEKMVANLDETNNQLKDIVALVENKLAILDALKVAKANNELKALNEAYEAAKAENLESFEFKGQTFKVINESVETQVEEKFRYTEDDINTLYGFYGTLETNFKKKDVERMYTEGVDGLMKAYKISEKVAIAILDSKVGRHMADMIYSKIATDAVDALAKYFGSGARVWNYITSMIRLEESLVFEAGDHEVGMANGQLADIVKNAQELMSKIGTTEKDIPGWIQDHISQSQNYINQANSNYHELEESALSTISEKEVWVWDAVGVQLEALREKLNQLLKKSDDEKWTSTLKKALKQLSDLDNTLSQADDKLGKVLVTEAASNTWGTYSTPDGANVAKAIDKAYTKFSNDVSKAFDTFKSVVRDYSVGSKKELGNKSGFNDTEGEASITFAIKDLLAKTFDIDTKNMYYDAFWMFESIKINEAYDVELFWKGLSGEDKKIGRFLVSKKDYEALENDFGSEVEFDLYDDKASGKTVKFNDVVSAMKNTKYGKTAMKESVEEALKSDSPNDVITIQLDMAWDPADEKEAKAAFKKYKIKVVSLLKSTGEPGTYDVTGKKKDILAYLQSEFYEMDDETIEEYYPELLESFGSSAMGLSKAQTKKVAETLAKAISKNDGVNCTVNAKTLEEDSFDLDIDGELGAAGSYNIYDDGSVVNHAVTPNEIYGNYKSTVEEFVRGLKKPIYESVILEEAKEIEVSLRYARLANDVFDDMYRRLGKKTSTNTFKMNSDDLADDFLQSLIDAGVPQDEIYEGYRPMTDEEKAEKRRKEYQLKRLRDADKKSAELKRLKDLQSKMHQDRLKKSNQ